MARGSRGAKEQPPRRPVDLTGIISIAERNDLITLVSAITERMHANISNVFDSPPITPIEDGHGHLHWLSLSLSQLKENKPPNSLSQLSITDSDESNPQKPTGKVVEKEEGEAMTPQLRELKREALLYFRKWQAAVLQRLRDMSVTEPTTFNTGSRGRGRGYRGGFRGRGSRGSAPGRGGLTLATGIIPPLDFQVDIIITSQYPPVPNSLWNLPTEKRKLIMHLMLLMILSLQEYTANARLLLLNLASSLNVPLRSYQCDETRVAEGLAQTAIESLSSDDDQLAEEPPRNPRKSKPGYANASNGSGILSTPLIACGIGTAHAGLGLTPQAAAGLLGIMSDNGFLMGCLFGISEIRPTIKMTEAIAKEIQDFAFVSLLGDQRCDYREAKEVPSDRRRLRVVIGVSGFLIGVDDAVKTWQCLGRQAETYAVRWEATALLNFGSALETVIKSTAWSIAKREIMSRTIFTSLIDSIWPVPLLKISKIIDNPWSVGMVRAEKAGAILADALVRHRFQGDRPVSLIGYSLAARAIYSCLMVLAERRQFGIVDSVVLMGTPAPSESRVWLTLKSVVSGRLINVYSENDYILGFLYRTSNIQFGVAGLQEIQGANGVENHKVVNLSSGHLGYQFLAGKILRDIGWEDLEPAVLKPMKGNSTNVRGSKKK